MIYQAGYDTELGVQFNRNANNHGVLLLPGCHIVSVRDDHDCYEGPGDVDEELCHPGYGLHVLSRMDYRPYELYRRPTDRRLSWLEG